MAVYMFCILLQFIFLYSDTIGFVSKKSKAPTNKADILRCDWVKSPSINKELSILSAIETEYNCVHDKQMIITLLIEHWEEFLDILNETYQKKEIDTFPPSFYQFTQLLSYSLKKAAHINTAQSNHQDGSYPFSIDQESFDNLSLKRIGLLQRASQLHKKMEPNDKPHNTIINDNGIFIIQRKHTYNAPDETFQNLVNSVLS